MAAHIASGVRRAAHVSRARRDALSSPGRRAAFRAAAGRLRPTARFSRPFPQGNLTGVSGKVMTMAEAIERFVPDGSTVAMGTSLEPLIPFAAGHELIRQRRRDLELVGPISDALFDKLIAAGCVRRVTAAWVGNLSEGLGHCYRRACEQGVPNAIEGYDHSNFSISLALWAAAWNVPRLPTRTLLGSDILRTNPTLSIGFGMVHVGAVRPDIAIVHVQRADAEGRAHAWGPLGITEEAGLAPGMLIITREELIDDSVTLSSPNRILFPDTKCLSAVR